jgi:hypothetical protein
MLSLRCFLISLLLVLVWAQPKKLEPRKSIIDLDSSSDSDVHANAGAGLPSSSSLANGLQDTAKDVIKKKRQDDVAGATPEKKDAARLARNDKLKEAREAATADETAARNKGRRDNTAPALAAKQRKADRLDAVKRLAAPEDLPKTSFLERFESCVMASKVRFNSRLPYHYCTAATYRLLAPSAVIVLGADLQLVIRGLASYGLR